MSRVLEFLRGLPKVGKVEVPESVRRGLLWWKVFFFLSITGVSMMPWQKWSAPDEVVATDACLQGCGAWFKLSPGVFFMHSSQRVSTSRNLSINALELLTVVVAAKVWGKDVVWVCEL